MIVATAILSDPMITSRNERQVPMCEKCEQDAELARRRGTMDMTIHVRMVKQDPEEATTRLALWLAKVHEEIGVPVTVLAFLVGEPDTKMPSNDELRAGVIGYHRADPVLDADAPDMKPIEDLDQRARDLARADEIERALMRLRGNDEGGE